MRRRPGAYSQRRGIYGRNGMAGGHLKGAQMPNDKDNGRDHSDGSPIVRNIALLTLPWLFFQRDVLALIKRGIEDASHIRPIENFAWRELQALMMILDPSGKWRTLFDRDLQNELKETYTKHLPKLISSSLQTIENQEEVLASLSELFEKLRKNNKSSSDKSGRSPEHSE